MKKELATRLEKLLDEEREAHAKLRCFLLEVAARAIEDGAIERCAGCVTAYCELARHEVDTAIESSEP